MVATLSKQGEEELASILANLKGPIKALKTERLVLREYNMPGDIDALYGLESIPEVARYNSHPPMTREQAQNAIKNVLFYQAILPRSLIELAVTTQDGQFIGRVGALVKRPRFENSEIPHVVLWYSFMPEMQGKGYATEAVTNLMELLGSPLRLEIECDPRNGGSIKLAERLGFEKASLTVRAYECKGEWVDSLVYRKTV